MINNAPSSVELREHCPGSGRLTEGLEKLPQTEDAKKGLTLHDAIAQVLAGSSSEAACLTHGITDAFDMETVRVAGHVIQRQVKMLEQELNAQAGAFIAELPIDLQASGWDGRARLDFVCDFTDADGALVAVLVVENKTGLMVQSGPDANRQMHDYLVGAAVKFQKCETFIGAILQPAVVTELQWRQSTWTREQVLGHFREMGLDEETLRPGLAMQLKSIRKATMDPAAPLTWGDHCGICRAKEMCPARRGTVEEARKILADSGSTVAEYMAKLSPADRLKAWETAKEAARYLKKFDEMVKAWILDKPAENVVPGYKVGRRPGNRIFDDKKAATVLAAQAWELAGPELEAAGIAGPEGLLEVIGPKKVEDLLPESAFAKLQAAGLVVRPEGSISVLEDKAPNIPKPRKKA